MVSLMACGGSCTLELELPREEKVCTRMMRRRKR